MRQRNTSGYPQHVSLWPTKDNPDGRPFTVGPGEETDQPKLLAGFTSLEPDPEPEPEPADAPEPPAAPAASADQAPATKTKKPAAQPAIEPGGESA